MIPFANNLPIDALNADDELWSVMQATTDDGSMLIRVNTTARRWAKHPALAIRVGFAVPLNHPFADADTAAAENFELNQMEGRILAVLQSYGPAIHVLTITTGTFKEFVFYIQNGDAVADVHKTIETESPSHEVQCIAVHDPAWTLYDSFTR